MSIKNELRKKYKQARKNISEKRSKDKLINEFLCNMECYKSCDMVLFYAALDDEVNLDLSIKASLDYGKKVALPVCIDNKGKMQYYYIRSLDDIKIGAFGVREPDVNFCTLVDDYTDAICIVPAIAFDKSGYRLGYGKGYYDSFLCNLLSWIFYYDFIDHDDTVYRWYHRIFLCTGGCEKNRKKKCIDVVYDHSGNWSCNHVPGAV